jgi:hypothetical protein
MITDGLMALASGGADGLGMHAGLVRKLAIAQAYFTPGVNVSC